MTRLQTQPYRICSRCVMDSSDPEIVFDAKGVCNHCHRHDQRIAEAPFSRPDRAEHLARLVAEIKGSRRGDYDCVVGVSGGVDSSFVAYHAKQLGLRPLAVHFDNGWNSELAVKNIENVVKKLGIDLRTYVIDWQEFRDLQRAFFRAGVIDIEMITDHAINASMLRLARAQRIKYVLSGTNVATETVMPRTWLHMKFDLRNLKAIHRLYGAQALRTFPTMSVWMMALYHYVLGIRSVSLLDYVGYRKAEALQIMEKELGWRYYGGKHYESVFTKFYQAHILPEKFGVDKRRCHFSNLILNEELSREEAIRQLEQPLYAAQDLANDREFVLKKLGFSAAEFASYLEAPPVAHESFPSDAALAKRLIEWRRRFA